MPLFSITCDSGANITSKDKDILNEINELNIKAFNMQNNQLDSAILINGSLFSMLKACDSSMLNYELTLSNLLSVRGSLYQEKRNYEKAMDDFLKSAEIRQRLSNYDLLSNIQLNIANLYETSKNYKKSIEFLLKAKQNRDISKKEVKRYEKVYNSLGLSYDKLEVADSAFKYYYLALGLAEKGSKAKDDVLSNLAVFYKKNDSLKKSLETFLKVERQQRKKGNYYDLSWTLNEIGKVYTSNKNYLSAKLKLKEGLELSKKYGNIEVKKDIFYSFFRLGLASSDYELMKHYLDKYESLNDTLYQRKSAIDYKELEEKYEAREKDRALQFSQNETRNRGIYIFALLITLSLVSIFAVFTIRNSRQKATISKMEVEMKEQKIDELLQQQENASYAALLKGQEEERQRIARDLHDRLGNTLATLRLALQGESSKNQEIELVDLAVSEVREVAQNLSEGVLSKHGLNAALKELKQLVEESGVIKFDLFLNRENIAIGQSIELEIYRIIQELVSNTLKHAKATNISLQTRVDNKENFHIIFEDNGQGFNPNEVKEGMGMKNIRQRAKLIHANCHVDSKKGRGTIVIIDTHG